MANQLLSSLFLASALASSACASSPAEHEQLAKGLSLRVSVRPPVFTIGSAVDLSLSLTNQAAQSIAGCLVEKWGVNLVDQSGQSGGDLSTVDHSNCVQTFNLGPGESLTIAKSCQVGAIAPGEAKFNAWVAVASAASCGPKYGCLDESISTALETVQVAAQQL